MKSPAHPRACGENSFTSDCSACVIGSSPRMRGKHRCDKLVGFVRGLIPAHAGKTLPPPQGRQSQVGSSPRMRGKRAYPLSGEAWLRLIPAHAGKSPGQPGAVRAGRAHPRACGENIYGPGVWPMPVGSSPRMRGKLAVEIGLRRAEGLIPAHAGKTDPQGESQDQARAHPRACGENDPANWWRFHPAGSSPRMRGKRVSLCV